MAFHASATTSPTSIDAAWSINGHIAPSQKFWGRSFELMFPGNFSVTFKDTGETFSVVKPSSFVCVVIAHGWERFADVVFVVGIWSREPSTSRSSAR